MAKHGSGTSVGSYRQPQDPLTINVPSLAVMLGLHTTKNRLESSWAGGLPLQSLETSGHFEPEISTAYIYWLTLLANPKLQSFDLGLKHTTKHVKRAAAHQRFSSSAEHIDAYP